MDSPKRIITKSLPSKAALVTYVIGLLTRFAVDRTLQLTIIIAPETYEVSFVTTATTGFSPRSGKIQPTLVA